MHRFADLVDGCTALTLRSLGEVSEKVLAELEHSGATRLVVALQTVQLQKAIVAVGMFSMFEATLQNGLNYANGFREADEILRQSGEDGLRARFSDLLLAINVLKHGRGPSYDKLVSKADSLSFRVKLPGEGFFSEGDVSEVWTLVEVDESFLLGCSDVIREVSEAIGRARSDYFS